MCLNVNPSDVEKINPIVIFVIVNCKQEFQSKLKVCGRCNLIIVKTISPKKCYCEVLEDNFLKRENEF